MTIYGIAAIGIGLALAIYIIRLFMNGRRQRREREEWQRSRARQERTFRPLCHGNEEDTKTYPTFPGACA